MRTRHRVDNNQKQIINELRKYECLSVHDTSALGEGFPDIVIGFKNMDMSYNLLVEIKSDGGKLTESEQNFHLGWHGDVIIAYSTQDIFSHFKRKYKKFYHNKLQHLLQVIG